MSLITHIWLLQRHPTGARGEELRLVEKSGEIDLSWLVRGTPSGEHIEAAAPASA
jgi:hypothetical protein